MLFDPGNEVWVTGKTSADAYRTVKPYLAHIHIKDADLINGKPDAVKVGSGLVDYKKLFSTLIADGCHLPCELLKMIVKIKGADRVCLITDSLRPAGIGVEGQMYTDCPVPFIIEDGVAKLCDRSAFAGSIATSDILLKTAVRSGIDLADAVKMMTQTPAKVMNLNTKGRIAVGFDADFTVFDSNFNIVNY